MSVFMVSAKTVEAINGIRQRGFWSNLKTISTGDGAYQLVAQDDDALKASVDENAGSITYAEEAVNG